MPPKPYVAPIVYQVDQIPEKFRKKYDKGMEVGLACKIISITNLDMAGGTFTADFNLNVAWKGEEDDKPEVQFYNKADDGDLDEAEPKKAPEGKDWDWFYRIRCRNTFRQEYKLQQFPFDSQDLKIDVRLKKECNLTHLAWGADGEAVSCDHRCLSEEFSLSSVKVTPAYLPSYKFGDLAGYDPEATLVFTIERLSTYWVVNYGLIPSILSGLMALCYVIPAESVDARLGFAMNLVLTMTAAKYLMMEKLPSVAYFTLLDIHVVVCCTILTVLSFEIGLAKVLGADKLAGLETSLILPAAGASWVFYHLYVLLRMFVI